MGIRNFRNMGILEIQQLVSQGYLRLIKDTTVSVATTSVTIDTDENSQAFSFGKDKTLLLVSDIVNPTTSNSLYNLLANNNLTLTNYYTQLVLASATTIVGARTNDSNIASIVDQDQKALVFSNIKLTNDGYFTVQSSKTRGYGSATPLLYDYVNSSTFTATSLTRFDIVADVTNAIGVGSRFMLFEVIN